MSAVQTLFTEDASWFRPGRSLSRASFDFSCFEEDGLLDYDSIESLLFPTNNNTPTLAAHPVNVTTQQPALPTGAQEEFKFIPPPHVPVQQQEVRMWPQLPMHHQQQEARFTHQPHCSEFQTHHHPVIHQNLLNNTPQQPAPAVTPTFQEELHHALDGNFELNNGMASKPVKLENFGSHNEQRYHQQINHTPACPHFKTTFNKSSEDLPRDCSSPDIEVKAQQKAPQYTFMDITPYMTLPQAEAARQLGIPVSTLSKRWRVATGRRKWPWRVVSKLDKEITTLLYNINIGTGNVADKDKDLEERLSYLLAKREKALRSVRIRISNANKSAN